MPNIICYVRPWNEQQFELINKHAFPSQKIIYVSDFKDSRYNILQKLFYKYLADYHLNITYSSAGLSEEDADDVRLRCRLLRNIDEAKAKKLIICMWQAIDEVYSQYLPETGIGLTIDSYVIDLIRLRLEYAEKQYLGVIVSFINGYFRLTARGEFFQQYSPTIAEVEDAYLSLLINEDKPHFLTPVKSSSKENNRIITNTVKDKLRYYFFGTKLIFSKDNYNYHYLVNKVNGKLRKELKFNLSTDGWDRLYEKEEQIKIFIPLQYFPEATVDYWVPSEKYIDYNVVLNELLDECSKFGVKVYVKEHPAILGMRPKGFYDKILANKHVELVPTYIDSQSIIKNTDITIVWTGSAGCEAALRGKPVIHLGQPYYNSGEWFYYLPNINDLGDAISWAQSQAKTSITVEEQKAMLKHILSGCLPGNFKQPKRSNKGWVFDKADMKVVGKSINNFIASGFFRSE